MLRKFFKTLTTTGLDIRWIGLRDDLHGRGQHRLRPKVERTSRTERFLLRSSGKKPTTITYQNVSFVQKDIENDENAADNESSGSVG